MERLCRCLLVTLLALVICGVKVGGQYSSSTPKDQLENFTPKLPKNLCRACHVNIKTINKQDGSFDKPANIFNIWKNPKSRCMKKMKRYVKLNPGDTLTKNAYNEFVQNKNRSSKAYQRLERVAYTFCEQCCDCIDVESPKNTPKLDIKRPNCALHFVYDVVTDRGAFPDMKYQDYSKKKITGGVITPDIEKWLKCKQQADGGRITVRDDQGIQGYYSRRRRLASVNMSAREEPIMDGEALLAMAPKSSRTLLQDCSGLDAAVNRVYAQLKDLADWIGCGSTNSYKACHYMEYTQGRVCDGNKQQDPTCIGKNW